MANFLDRYAGYPQPKDEEEEVVPPMAPKGTISEPALAQLEKTNPDLVAQYRERMQASSDALKDAQSSQDMGNYANVGGRLLNDLNNSQKRDVILKNRYQDMGKAPTVRAADRPAYDDSIVNNLTAQDVTRAKDQRQIDSQDFGEEQKLTDIGTQRADQKLVREKAAREADPTSDESKQAREVLKRAAPNSADIPGFETMSAAQVSKVAPQLMERYKQDQLDKAHRDDMNQKSQDRALQREALLAKAESAPTMGQKEVDKGYAKEYNEYNNTGRPTLDKNLKRLEDAKATLLKRKGDLIGTSGRITGRLPDIARSEESIRLRQDVQAAAQGALKATLGAQFTEREGERIMAAAYDEKLSPEENIKKIDAAIAELKQHAQNNNDRAAYYEDHGTLKGWKSPSTADAGDKGSGFPRTITKDGHSAQVSNEAELKEAQDEGWK